MTDIDLKDFGAHRTGAYDDDHDDDEEEEDRPRLEEARKPKGAPTNKLFVGSLSVSVTDEDIRNLFARFGDLIESKVIVDQVTGTSKGYAFVTFKHIEDATRAAEDLDGTAELAGRLITVEPAQDKKFRRDFHRFQEKPALISPGAYSELPPDKANAIPFPEFAKMLDNVRASRGAKAKLAIFFDNMDRYLQGGGWYPVMRLVLPDADRERPRYNLKEHSLAKLIVKTLGLDGSNNPDGKRMLNWKDPAAAQAQMEHHQANGGGAVGDFPNVLRKILAHRGFDTTSTKRLTVGDINAELDKLHNATTAHEREEVFIRLLRSCNAAEMYWITRIILKTMNCGLKTETVMRRYHKDGVDAMSSHGDLRRAIAELSDPSVSREYTVEIFAPANPMLAKILPIDRATARLGDFAIEPKMDGDRMLIHIDKTAQPKPKVMLFTRQGTNYTERYGAPELISNLLQAFQCNKCIVDGEMLSWDEEHNHLVEFGENTTVANEMMDTKNYKGNRWLYFVCFDALLIDDGRQNNIGIITGESLRVRRQRLQSILVPNPKKVELVDAMVVTDRDLDNRHSIIMNELDKMITIKGEGLILKSLASPYLGGDAGRKTGHWVKIKPSHVDGLAEQLDCLILGGYFSEGARRSSANALDPSVFLVGVPGGHKKTADGHPAEFFCLAKIGTGYKFAELYQIRDRLRPHFIRTAEPGAPRPTHFAMPVRKGDFPDVWIPPEHSLILQVTGQELVPCDWFSANYTLRFPRCTRIRWDKAWYEATPFSEVQRFAADFQLGKGLHGARRAIDVSRMDAGRNGRRHAEGSVLNIKRRRAAPAEILGVGSTAHLNDVEVEDNPPLEGWSFYVFPCSEGFDPVKHHPEIKTLEDVELYLKRKGGRVVKTQAIHKKKAEDANVILIASSRALKSPTIAFANAVKSQMYDVLKMDFVIDCCEGGVTNRDLRDRRFSDYLVMSKATCEHLGPDLDKFGDSYTERADFLSLERCMNKVPPPDSSQPMPLYVRDDDDDDPLAISSNFFRGIIAYFPPQEEGAEIDIEAKLAEAMVRLHGGAVTKTLDAQVTHVFFSRKSKDQVKQVKKEIEEKVKPVALQHKKWVEPFLMGIDFLFDCAKSESNLTWDLFPSREYMLDVEQL